MLIFFTDVKSQGISINFLHLIRWTCGARIYELGRQIIFSQLIQYTVVEQEQDHCP